jgi:hypothetical protein
VRLDVTHTFILCLHTFLVIDICFSLFTFFASFSFALVLSCVFVIHSSWRSHTQESFSHIQSKKKNHFFSTTSVVVFIVKTVCHNALIKQTLFISSAYICINIQLTPPWTRKFMCWAIASCNQFEYPREVWCILAWWNWIMAYSWNAIRFTLLLLFSFRVLTCFDIVHNSLHLLNYLKHSTPYVKTIETLRELASLLIYPVT